LYPNVNLFPAFKGLSAFHLYEKYLELMNPEGKVFLMLDEIQEICPPIPPA